MHDNRLPKGCTNRNIVAVMTSNHRHVVLHAANSWGHLRQILGIAVRMAQARPNVIFTILTSGLYHAKVTKELLRATPFTDRFNVMDIQGTPDGPAVLVPEFGRAFECLWKRKDLTCRTSGKVLSGLPQPTVAVICLISYDASEAVQSIAGRSCSILLAGLTSACSLLSFGPRRLGGLDDVRARMQANVSLGDDLVAAGHKVWTTDRTKGEICQIPGLPPFYDYEWLPQRDDLPHAHLFQDTYRHLLLADAVLVPSTSFLEAESIQALRGWLEPTGSTVWPIGSPSAPEDEVATTDTPAYRSEDDNKVLAFLDRIVETHGAQSLIYISFGSIFIPGDLARFWAFIDELLASNTPFLFTLASPRFTITSEQAAAITASGSSLVVKWAPQDAVLAHPAMGWYLTHGGWNSTQEALLAKVPLIFWPVAGDQPSNAVLITLVHDAAFELLSVRSGFGERLPYRCRDGRIPAPDFSVEGCRQETRALLARLCGDDGRRVRINFDRLGEAYRTHWQDGGEAKIALEGLLTKYVDP